VSTPVRVLLVDDSSPWRCATREILEDSELEFVGEAADGAEALRQAAALKPDLILLDIGLPGMDGLEVAKRIHSVLPKTTILFVSMNRSSEVIRTALTNGARGYVLKADAARELSSAIKAVLQGTRFVSAGVRCEESLAVLLDGSPPF
jgi:two-component system nitrate/nitrite response regulator NarL